MPSRVPQSTSTPFRGSAARLSLGLCSHIYLLLGTLHHRLSSAWQLSLLSYSFYVNRLTRNFSTQWTQELLACVLWGQRWRLGTPLQCLHSGTRLGYLNSVLTQSEEQTVLTTGKARQESLHRPGFRFLVHCAWIIFKLPYESAPAWIMLSSCTFWKINLFKASWYSDWLIVGSNKC